MDICRLCGASFDRLTKDHIQSQCAFNETHRRFVKLKSDITLATKSYRPKIGKRHQHIYYELGKPSLGGIYARTQCQSCNNYLGNNYDARFGKWCHDAVDQMKRGTVITVQKTYEHVCHYPLSILKRIAAMFFSINGDRFHLFNRELADFVLDRDSQKLPSDYRFFIAFTINDIVSHIPMQVRKDIRFNGELLISQIVHPRSSTF